MRGSQLKKELGPLVHSSKARTCFWMACIETCCAFVTVTSATPFWGDNWDIWLCMLVLLQITSHLLRERKIMSHVGHLFETQDKYLFPPNGEAFWSWFGNIWYLICAHDDNCHICNPIPPFSCLWPIFQNTQKQTSPCPHHHYLITESGALSRCTLMWSLTLGRRWGWKGGENKFRHEKGHCNLMCNLIT
jgi:hypothetical protein